MAQLLRDFVKIENDFTIIPNEISRNKEMKSSTKNILIAMLSLPPTWDFSIAGITTCVREGYDTVQKALVELEQMGYITRNREHREDGTFGAMIYTIHQFPVSEDKNTYKNNHKNQDRKTPIQEKTNIGKNQGRENSVQLNIDNKLNKDSELNTDKESSTDVKSNTDNKYALEDVKRPSSKGDMYASVPEEHKDVQPKKQSRYIPPDYTKEQLIEHIRPTIEENLKTVQEDCGMEYNPKCADDIVEIVTDFFEQYKEKTGCRHKILPDATLINIMYQYLNPPECLCNSNEPSTYSAMAEEYLDTNFNARGGYDGEVTLSISHFMSDKIRENCYQRIK